MNVAGTYVIPNCTTPEALGNKTVETARQMAAEIVNEAEVTYRQEAHLRK